MAHGQTFVVALGHGQVNEHSQKNKMDHATMARLRRAIARVHELTDSGTSAAGYIFAAGVGKTRSHVTMAALMGEHVVNWMRTGYERYRVPVYQNGFLPEVWGTIEELRWAWSEAQRHSSDPILEVVTNRRHGLRVLAINKLIIKGSVRIIDSDHIDDPPPPWSHEAVAYLKLLIVWLGPQWLDRFLHRIRRAIQADG